MADASLLASGDIVDTVRIFAGQAITLVGALFVAVGSIGVLRFPDFYTRMHSASVTDTLGATLVLAGMALLAGWSLVTFKVFIIWLSLLLTSPTASNAAAHAALKAGLEPLQGKWTGDPVEKPQDEED